MFCRVRSGRGYVGRGGRRYLVGVTGRCLLVVPLAGVASAVPRLETPASVPHVTLVDPFTLPADEGTVAELEMFFADVVPFAVRLVGVSQFPSGSTYLTPEPATPFRRLTHELNRVFPELPRRPASFEDAPHVPVTLREDETLENLQQELEPWLPATTVAREATLWEYDGHEVRTVAVFPFATSAA